MIKKENNSVLISKKINIYLCRKYNNKTPIFYMKLLSYQQEGTFFENINEIAKTLKYCKRTTLKYINILKNEGLIYKLDNIYIINMSPQKEILKAEIKRINRQDKYLFNKYMKAD